MLLMGEIRPERLMLAGMCMGRCDEEPFFLCEDGASAPGATAVGVIAISGSFLLPATPQMICTYSRLRRFVPPHLMHCSVFGVALEC